MKPFSLVPVCLAATLFLAPSGRAVDAPATPDDNPATQNPSGSAARQAEILKRFDTNGDGKLDDQEKAAAKAAGQKRRAEAGGKARGRLLDRYDKNHDGRLDDTERAAALADFEARPRVIKQFDKNGDGVLNAEEKAAAEQWIRDRWAKGQE